MRSLSKADVSCGDRLHMAVHKQAVAVDKIINGRPSAERMPVPNMGAARSYGWGGYTRNEGVCQHGPRQVTRAPQALRRLDASRDHWPVVGIVRHHINIADHRHPMRTLVGLGECLGSWCEWAAEGGSIDALVGHVGSKACADSPGVSTN